MSDLKREILRDLESWFYELHGFRAIGDVSNVDEEATVVRGLVSRS